VWIYRSLNSSANKRFLDLLEPVKLTVWKVVIERITVVKFGMDIGGCNGAGCSEVKIWTDTAKFTDMIVARFRKCRNCSEKVRCSSKIKPSWFRAERVV